MVRKMKSYQLYINIKNNVEIKIGKLGRFKFPKGDYIYTGSAKRNIDSRIARHRSKDKKLHWHIDFLLNNENAKITKVEKADEAECILNQETNGDVIVDRFGSSDCKNGCKSHLKIIKNSALYYSDLKLRQL
jgi:Uri superfamily endonuclease